MPSETAEESVRMEEGRRGVAPSDTTEENISVLDRDKSPEREGSHLVPSIQNDEKKLS